MKNTIMFWLSFIVSVILSVTMILWSITTIGSENEITQLPSPMRWLVALTLPSVVTYWGFQRKSLNLSGVVLAWFLGFVLSVTNLCFSASLITFFITSSKATKYKSKIKKTLEEDFKEGGQRDWVQVICNGAVAVEFAICFLLEKGFTEIPINFIKDYNSCWFAMGVLGAIGCANGDTWASELGSVLSKNEPNLITSLKKVPKGTNGAISLIGLIVSALGGGLIGIVYLFVIIIFANSKDYNASPPQWPIIIVGLFSGLFGSIIDSLLGSTLQYSGIDKRSGRIVENPGRTVEHVSGLHILDNHSVNLVSTLITALVTPSFAIMLWDYIE